MVDKIKENKITVGLAVVVFLLVNYATYYLRVMYQDDLFNGIVHLVNNPLEIFTGFPISFNGIDLLVSAVATTIVVLLLVERNSNRKNYRKGEEHGSAQWGKIKEYHEMMDLKEPDNNIIFSKNLKIRLDDKDAPFDTRRNKNVVVYGGSGSGKTRFVVKPNLLQMNASYVVTDPKGTIVNEVGMALKNKGNYKIKIFNTVNFNKSMKYNPLEYVKTESDILSLVDTLISNTNAENQQETFWTNTEKLLYQAYLSLIVSKFPKEERHLGTLIDLIAYSEVKEDDEDYKNAVDYLFEGLEKEDPDHFALKQYRAYKLAAGKTAKSILISCATRLAPFNIPEVRNLLSKDELNLYTLGDKADDKGEKGRKTALFVIIPDTDPTFNFLASIMYTQLFDILVTRADEKYGGSLPTHVRFLLDEFANIGLIPNFDKLIATIRSRNMSATVILQTASQLKSIYKDNSETIIGNCDTSIFLGGDERSTIKSISEQLGRETIDDYNESRTRSNADSYGQNYSKLGRALMTEDELKQMPRDTCIVQIVGRRPFKDKKYPLENHPRYKYHSEGEGQKYWFDLEKYLNAIQPNKKKKPTKKTTKKEKQDVVEPPKVPVLINTATES
jgi:type IV secretion system protein VirD4